MHFGALTVANLRCLKRLEYQPIAGLNLVWGANGSGKTSLLEGLAVAGLGKSFLTNRTADLVRYGARGMSIRALTIGPNGLSSQVVIRKDGAQTRITLDGQPVLAASVLAHHLPLMVFNSKAADLLTESPSNRRALVDRTMFHVEPSYGGIWKRYRLVLRQRNELIRLARRAEMPYWDTQLSALAAQIDQARRRVVAVINSGLEEIPSLPNVGRLAFDYQPGWNTAAPLSNQLEQAWVRDCQAGYTTLGSHRGDLSLRANGRSVSRKLSRGQGKFVVCVVIVALAHFIRECRGVAPVMLVDDLAAELDDIMRTRAVDMITGVGGQSIFTAIKPRDLPEVSEAAQNRFHVEQHVSLHEN